MPAKSEQQQKLFGLALSVKRGETPRSDVSDDVLNIVDNMTEKEIEDYSGTKHDDIPKKVKEELRPLVREVLMYKVLNEGRAENLWNDVFNSLDKKFKKFDTNTVNDVNKVAKILQKTFTGLPQKEAMTVATYYSDYKRGDYDKNSAIKKVVKSMSKYKKESLDMTNEQKIRKIVRKQIHEIIQMENTLMNEGKHIILSPKDGISKGEAKQEATDLFKLVEKAPKIKLVGRDDGVYDTRKTGTNASTLRIEFTVDSDKELDLIKRLAKSYKFNVTKVTNESINEEETPYQAFFKKAMDKFGVSSPDEFESEEKKKEFFDYVDKKWDAKNESINEEASRLATEFFQHSKHGKAIHKLLKGKWDSKKVEKYLDVVVDKISSPAQSVRFIESIARSLAVDVRKYDTVGDMTPAILNSMENLYKDLIQNESINEASGKEIAKKMKKSKAMKGFADKVSKMKTVTKNDLEKMLPDYVKGKDIYTLFEETVNEADDTGVKYGDQGHVKFIPRGMNSKKRANSVTVNGKKYKYNSVYKTYNSVKGNELLHKNDISKAKSVQREGRVNETKFFVWYKKKKHEIEADSLYKAKEKFIKQERVPKSKQGLIAIKSAGSMKQGDYRFEGTDSVELQRGREWDIGAGQFPTGLVFWNRAEEEHGDYKKLAIIDKRGNIKYYDKKLPSFVTKHIEKHAKRIKNK